MAYKYTAVVSVPQGHYESQTRPTADGKSTCTSRTWVQDPSKTCRVEVEIDTDELARVLGRKAAKSVQRKATALSRLVIVRAGPLQEPNASAVAVAEQAKKALAHLDQGGA